MRLRRISAILAWVLSAVVAVGVLAFGWFIRDGLGPDAVESHGFTATERIWESGAGWGLVFFAAPLAVIGFLLYPKQYNRGVITSFCVYLGASVCTLVCGLVFLNENFSRHNTMSEDAVFDMTLHYIVMPIAACIGGAVGGAAGWRLTRTRR